MNFKIENGCVIFKKRLLEDENFNNLFCNSLNKLFSFEIDTPRILINEFYENFSIFFKKMRLNCEICFKNGLKKQNFCLCTHFCEFDLGLFIEQKKDSFVVKLISGSGKKLSPVKQSVLENEFEKSGYFESENGKNIDLKMYKVLQKVDENFNKKVHIEQLQKLSQF